MNDRFTTGLDLLEVGDDRYKNLKPREEENQEFDYTKRVPVGRVTAAPEDSTFQSGEILFVDVESSSRIGIYGKTGAGKTWLSKVFITRLFKAGHKVVHASDVKNDFHDLDNKGGIDKESIRKSAGLMPSEERQPTPKKMFMPKFLADDYPNSVPVYLEPFTFGLDDISQSDLGALVELNSRKQKDLIMSAWRQTEPKSFKNLYQSIDDLEDVNASTKKAIKSSVKSLEEQDVLAERFREDPLAALEDNVVSLALENWKNYKRAGVEKLEIYISILLRRLQQKLQYGDMQGPVLVFIDEAHAFVPANRDSISKEDVVDLVDLGRTFDIPMLFATQRPSQLPEEDIIEQQSHFFIAPNLPSSQRKTLLKKADLWRYGDIQRNKWVEIFNNIDKHQWMYVDRELNEWCVVEPLAPLSAHTG